MMCAIKIFRSCVSFRVRAAKKIGRKDVPKTYRIWGKEYKLYAKAAIKLRGTKLPNPM